MKNRIRLCCLITISMLLLLVGCGVNKQADISELSDGEYLVGVQLEGGTGRAAIESPASLFIKDKEATVQIIWSSPFYDYMLVDGTRYENLAEDGGNSTFLIPVSKLDEPLTVIADTTAMSVPHEIEYTITFSALEGAID